MATFNPNEPKYNPSLSVPVPKSIVYLGRDQFNREPRPQPSMETKRSEEEEVLRIHYQNLALKQHLKPLEKPTAKNQNKRIPDLNYSSTPWES